MRQKLQSRVIYDGAPAGAAFIELTHGQVSIVDAEDAERLSAVKWSAAWSTTTRSFKAQRSLKRTVYAPRQTEYMHRVVMRADPGLVVDHINHDTLDNRKANLRVCEQKLNMRNKRKSDTAVISRFKGVTKKSNCASWVAQIKQSKTRQYIGSFATEVEAARAYDAKAIELHGEFACTNASLGLYEK